MAKKFGMIGINGFGIRHYEAVRKLIDEGKLECVAFVSRNPDGNVEGFEFLKSKGAVHYTDYHEMLKNHPEMSFVTIATPIHLHKSMSIEAMESGFNVYLEKPPAVLIQELDEMIEIEKKTGKKCAIGFQNTSGAAFLKLKEILVEGALGKVTRVCGVGLRKRTDQYYARTSWAGKLIVNGEYVFDGTIFNPLAHLLNNCLIAAGCGNPLNAMPKTVRAELYRSRDIEGEDTACIDIMTENGVKVDFYSTLTNLVNESPTLTVYGELGTATWNWNKNTLQMNISGKSELYEPEENYSELIYKMISNLSESLDTDKTLYCPLTWTRPFVLTGDCAYKSFGNTVKIPDEYLDVYAADEKWNAVNIKGIKDIILKCAEKGTMYSDEQVPWAVKSKAVDASKIKSFSL